MYLKITPLSQYSDKQKKLNKKIISNGHESFFTATLRQLGGREINLDYTFTAPPRSGGITYNTMRRHIYNGLGGGEGEWGKGTT